MGREKRPYTPYQAMPSNSRFWVYSESCYTEAELEFRIWLLNARAHSGVHADYLSNPNSWFAEDEQALVNMYENSWFFSNAYKTRHTLTQDDFYVQQVDRLQWPQLYELMQKTGDYLVLRNSALRSEHLNQPMNFVLLDLNNILKGISQNPNIEQTQEQLNSFTDYVRTIEKHISPIVGSDRLYLANLRSRIDEELQPELTMMLESKLLKDRLGDVLNSIKKLATERNRILHFALNSGEVNPHAYDFSVQPSGAISAYPTLIAKSCASSGSDAVSTGVTPTLSITAAQLRQCPGLSLFTASPDAIEHYAKSISDLSQLTQFQEIIQQVINLLGQAGEVYTVHQFKEQLLQLLSQVDHFIDESSLNTQEVIRDNTKAYKKAIHDEQNMSFWARFLSSDKEQLTRFFKNQDALGQFPSRPTDLLKTNGALKKDVEQVLVHLKRPLTKEANFAALAQQAQQLDLLMGSMHQWTKTQHEVRGIEAPKIPEKLGFWSHPENASINTSPIVEAVDLSQCSSSECPEHSFSTAYLIGGLALIPIGLIALYLLIRSRDEAPATVLGTKENFEEAKVKLDDLITQMKGYAESEDTHVRTSYAEFLDDYEVLVSQADLGNYNVNGLNELYKNLEYFKKEFDLEPFHYM